MALPEKGIHIFNPLQGRGGNHQIKGAIPEGEVFGVSIHHCCARPKAISSSAGHVIGKIQPVQACLRILPAQRGKQLPGTAPYVEDISRI
jgi:hypothetical protein